LLAKAAIATSETAMGECVGKAAELEGNLDTAGWQTFELIKKLPDEHQATAQAILTDLKESTCQGRARRRAGSRVEIGPGAGHAVAGKGGREKAGNNATGYNASSHASTDQTARQEREEGCRAGFQARSLTVSQRKLDYRRRRMSWLN
jgi:hypothetical protein